MNTVEFVSGFSLALLTVGPAFAAEDGGVCQQASQAELTSCQLAAQSQYSLSLGVCYNITDRGSQAACLRQAQKTQTSAGVTCKAQAASRSSFCQQTGGGAYDPVINPAQFGPVITNPYLPLTPGTTLVYHTQTPEGLEVGTFEVTSKQVVIMGVTCLEVRDTSTVDGALTEDTLDWFAQDSAGNVWYFGENSKQYSDGLIVGVAGSWTAGVDGAKPGIVMLARPQVGDIYRQEFAMSVAEDFGRVLGLNEYVTVPYGSFSNVVQTLDSSTLEPAGREHKYFANGIGNVLSIDLATGERTELVQIIKK